jgi:hypothetical protein
MSSDEHKDNERASAPGKPGLSRRSFLSRVGAAGIAATASPLMATVVAEQIGRKSLGSWRLYVLSGSHARGGISRQPQRLWDRARRIRRHRPTGRSH